MPYIPQDARKLLSEGRKPDTAGELNYLITRLVDEFLMRKGVSYTHINAAVGVLECAKMELYRRIASPYEDSKVMENGDAYVARG